MTQYLPKVVVIDGVTITLTKSWIDSEGRTCASYLWDRGAILQFRLSDGYTPAQTLKRAFSFISDNHAGVIGL